MFGSLGGAEILFLAVLALLLFGPRRLPEIGRTIGRGLSEFRRATHEFRATLEREADLGDVREVGRGLREAGREVAAHVGDVREYRADGEPSKPAAPEAPPGERGADGGAGEPT
jgi:TatA/E family protein of Tat protein translocase